ncbi:MAG: hypothetical protein ACXVFV_12010, partial [Mycobacteriales bacterium]
PAGRSSLVVEALAYVGGALVVIATLLLAGRYWGDLSTAARVALVGAGAVLLVVVGALVPAVPGTAGARLRSAVWLLATGATAGFMALLADQVLDLRGADTGLLATAGTALPAALLWRASRMVPQQAACFAALCGTAATALAEVRPSGQDGDALPGLGLLAVGTAWAALALLGRVGPRAASLALGGLGVVVGSLYVQQAGWGHVVGLLAVVALVALALRFDELLLLALGTVGLFGVLPSAVSSWFPGALAVPLVLLLCGGLLVLVALRAVRRRPGAV